MKKGRKWICVGFFVALCILTLNFLSRFSNADSPLLGGLVWDTTQIVGADGQARTVDVVNTSQDTWDLEAGDRFRLIARLPEAGEIPGLYEDAYLLMETGVGETVILLDGVEYLRYSAQDMGQDLDYQQLHLTLPPDAAGKELTILFAPYGGKYIFSPLYVRYSSEYAKDAFSAAYYNRAALPAGAYALGFLLLCAIFLVGVASGSPDWTLIPLALAADLTMVRVILESSGYYFLPAAARVLSSDYILLVPTALLLLYLLLNRRRSFWRYLVLVSLGMLVLAAGWYLYSQRMGGHFFLNVTAVLDNALLGYPRSLLIWLNTYLLAACGCIAACCLLQNLVRIQSEARVLAMKNDLILDNYHVIEQSVQRTSTLRHELKNYVAALDLLYQKGDMEGLGRRLGELKADTEKLGLPVFTDNYLVNAILQNAAARAGEAGIRFRAQSPLPAELPVDEVDLCSLLINLLDNALEAAGQVKSPKKRHVSIRLRINQGFLTVHCENSYDNPPLVDESGRFLTTKGDSSPHGLGIRQMEAIARKYGSTLDINFDGDLFTVQTALNLHKKKKTVPAD